MARCGFGMLKHQFNKQTWIIAKVGHFVDIVDIVHKEFKILCCIHFKCRTWTLGVCPVSRKCLSSSSDDTGKEPTFPVSVQAKDMFRIYYLSWQLSCAGYKQISLTFHGYSIGHNFLYLYLNYRIVVGQLFLWQYIYRSHFMYLSLTLPAGIHHV